VVCVIVPNKPGGLHKVLRILSDNDIQIDYMYAFAVGNEASVVLRAPSNENVIKVLQENKMELVRANQIYQI